MNKVKLFIATPCYAGMCYEGYVQSLVDYAKNGKHPFELYMSPNESLITKARNQLAKAFLESDCSHLIFIDADIEFYPDDLDRLIGEDKAVIVGDYPVKRYNWEAAVGMAFGSVDSLQKEITLSLTVGAENSQAVSSLVPIESAGTGFMCISRDALDKLIEAFPETKCSMFEGDECYALFDTSISKQGHYLNEDTTFCHRWREIGGTVWLHKGVKVSHYGTHKFVAVKD